MVMGRMMVMVMVMVASKGGGRWDGDEEGEEPRAFCNLAIGLS